ncbi:MAG: PilZ domain-containing protein [Hyphomonadaceae bacterium]|nr:MAG: hypothetical protein FD160_1953 [Caulobacteraceae bacterium]MBT9445471.1 PilZ domain-containing protein [Hyphomonadaceae bacterium]TPW04331.1 MAG: hypothetical protein FD124_2658 [Alphaproteobacteria bacterium]
MAANLARAHALMHLARREAPDRRRFRRLELVIGGRMMEPDGLEHDCRTLDISPGDARLASPARTFAGEKIIIYLKDIGRVESSVVRVLEENTFAVKFEASAHKRERIAEQLTVLANPSSGVSDERRHIRHDGASVTSIELEDGSTMLCEIIDFSLVGVAVRTARPRPLIGAWVKVGAQYARVSRYIEGGFAMDFAMKPKIA